MFYLYSTLEQFIKIMKVTHTIKRLGVGLDTCILKHEKSMLASNYEWWPLICCDKAWLMEWIRWVRWYITGLNGGWGLVPAGKNSHPLKEEMVPWGEALAGHTGPLYHPLYQPCLRNSIIKITTTKNMSLKENQSNESMHGDVLNIEWIQFIYKQVMKNKCDAILHTVHLICLLSAMYNGRKNMKVNIIYVSSYIQTKIFKSRIPTYSES